jgi:FtsZ-binding cell division protein ZapB
MSDNSEKPVLGKEESDRDVDAETDNVTQQAPDRRRLFHKLLTLAGLGITGALLSQEKTFLPQVKGTNGDPVLVGGTFSGTSPTEIDSGENAFFGKATSPTGLTNGVVGESDSTSGRGVQGYAAAVTGYAIGVWGVSNSSSGQGVQGYATSVTGANYGVFGQSNSTSGVGVLGRAGNAGAIPIVALGAVNQSANLQEWQKSDGTALSVVDANGNFGVGTNSPHSHLFVVDSTTNSSRGVVASQNNSGRQAALMQMTKSRGTQTAPSAVANGDYVGAFNMNAFDGTSYLSGKPMAGWGAKVNGTVAAGSIPADLFFYTKPSGTLDPYGDGVVRFIIASNGNIYANGSLLSSSDVRLKTDIEPIDNALEKVLALNGVYFQWNKSANQADGRQVGVIAQNVQQVLPEVVSTSPATKDYLSVDYTRLVPVLIEAVKELKTENNRLREQLTGNNQTLREQFKNENEKLHERIAILERTVKQFAAS